MTAVESHASTPPGVIIDPETYQALRLADELGLDDSVVSAPFVVTLEDFDLTKLPPDVARAFALSVLHESDSGSGEEPQPVDFLDVGAKTRRAVSLLSTSAEQWKALEAQPIERILQFVPGLRAIDSYRQVIRIQSDGISEKDLGGIYVLYTYEDLAAKNSPFVPASIAVAWNKDGSDVDIYRPTGNLGGGAVNEWVKYELPEPVDS